MDVSPYQVVTDSLTEHARALAGLADELDAAVEPGASGMTAEAYGQGAQRFAALMQELDRAGQEALAEGVKAFEDALSGLREVVATYEQGEATQISRFQALEAGGPTS